MSTQQQLEQELQGLLQACQAAPRYGANGRFLILQAARHIEEYEAEHGTAAVPPDPAGAAAEQHTPAAAAAAAGGLAAAQPVGGMSFTSHLSVNQALELVPPKERPFVTFVPRSFLTQAVRQQVVNRLTGAWLLTLVESLQLPPQQHAQVISSSPLLRTAAAAAALEAERALYRRITSPTAYQQQAPSLQPELSLLPADTWQQLVTQLAPQLASPPAVAQPAVNHHPQQQQKQQHEEYTQQQEQEQEQEQQQQEHQVQPDGVDVLFEDGEEVVEQEEGQDADEGTGEEGEGEQAGAGQQELYGEGRRPVGHRQHQQQQQRADKGGGSSRKRAAAEAAGEARRRQQQQQQQEHQDVVEEEAGVPNDVREQVLAHVLALLQPAVASGRLAPAQLARVATRASDKVCVAHGGARDAGFLLQHSGSVARLVEKLLAHYAGLPPQL